MSKNYKDDTVPNFLARAVTTPKVVGMSLSQKSLEAVEGRCLHENGEELKHPFSVHGKKRLLSKLTRKQI